MSSAVPPRHLRTGFGSMKLEVTMRRFEIRDLGNFCNFRGLIIYGVGFRNSLRVFLLRGTNHMLVNIYQQIQDKEMQRLMAVLRKLEALLLSRGQFWRFALQLYVDAMQCKQAAVIFWTKAKHELDWQSFVNVEVIYSLNHKLRSLV